MQPVVKKNKIKIKASHTNLIQILFTEVLQKERGKKRNSKKGIVRLLVGRRSV